MEKISLQRINRGAIAERRKNKKSVIITNILYILAMFLVSLGSIIPNGVDSIEIGLLFGVCGFVVGFMTNICLFNDLYNKQIADISLSTPMTGTERYLSKLLCIFYIQIIPALIAAIVGGNMFYFFFEKNIINSYALLTALILLILAGELFLFGICALCCNCCGTFGESVFFSFLLLLLQGVMPDLLLERIFTENSGLDWVSCHSMLWNLWGAGFENIFDIDTKISSLYLAILLNILISAVLIFISGIIYRKRDARVVGTPVTNKPFFEIMMFLGVILIYLMMFYSDAAVWAIIIAAAAYIIINIIVSRKKIDYKMVLEWAAKFAATTVIFIGVMLAAIKTNGFGYINTQPDINLDTSYCRIDVGDNTFSGENLTDSQCHQVMDIFQKYLKEGRGKASDILFNGNTNEEYYCDLLISKRMTEKELKEISDGNGCCIKYYEETSGKTCIDFEQHMEIGSYDDTLIEKLSAELKKLDFLTCFEDELY